MGVEGEEGDGFPIWAVDTLHAGHLFGVDIRVGFVSGHADPGRTYFL